VLATQISYASCISYNAVRVRVRLPDQLHETTFGAIVGQDSIRHSAFAIAGLEPEGFGGVLPFAVTGVDSGLGCLKSNEAGNATAICEGADTGNFGFMDFSQYGNNPSLNTTQSCAVQGTDDRIRANAAMGVDHELSLEGTVHVLNLVDTDACPLGIEMPDAANTETGNKSEYITDGLFFCDNGNGECPGNVFSDSLPARLQRTDSGLFGTGGSQIDGVTGVDDLDDNALWRFIAPNTGPTEATVADFPESCQRNQFVDDQDDYYDPITDNPNLNPEVANFLLDVDNTRDQIFALLQRCFTHYAGEAWDGYPIGVFVDTNGDSEAPSGCNGGVDATCDGAVFALDTDTSEDPNIFDIQRTPRFGYVPEIESFPSGQSEPRAFVRFRAVFIQRVVIEGGGTEDGNAGSNTDYWDPGFGGDYANISGNSETLLSNYSRVAETIVYVFPTGMLPNRLADEDAPFLLGVNRYPELIR
jgi:hypothetical protein